MAIELFGFEIKKKPAEVVEIPSFSPPETDDGALTVSAGGAYGTYLDLEGSAKTEAEIVAKYREMSIQPECEQAIEELVNEAIVKDGNKNIVDINLDDLDSLKVPERIKDLISEEWNTVSELFNFNNYGYEIFRRWYIDGRMYYHVMVDETNPRLGIQELRYIDPRKIRKVRNMRRERRGNIFVNVVVSEFFMYSERGYRGSSMTGMENQGLRIAKDSIVHITSGLTDKDNKLVLGYLHKAIKPLNQLRMLEDATVIYRISRAPERRIFYIDVGSLPKMKAEQYVKDMMTRHKNRLVYDATTGDIRDDRKFMTMLEDYWLPRREGGRGTEISTLPSGQNLGELSDVRYFEKKLYKALNVPMTRLDPETSGFNLGRSAEITQDELKFQKLINRLRLRFSQLFLHTLEKQLILKGILTSEDWAEYKNKIHFNFNTDSYFSELKDAEILRERLTTLEQITPYVGMFYSQEWVKKNILQQSDEDIEEMQKQIKSEEVMPGSLADTAAQEQQAQDMAMQQQGADAGGGAPPPAASAEPETTKSGRGPMITQIVQGKTGPYTRKFPEVRKKREKPREIKTVETLPPNFR
jgi:ribosomal protein L12E/L44/L45/RPP1/RPP2